jgi:hypothetical protein
MFLKNVKGKARQNSPITILWRRKGEVCIAPPHPRPRHYVGLSDQRHAPAELYPRGRTPATHWTGGWVGLKAGLVTKVRGKILLPPSGIEPPSLGCPVRVRLI